MTTSEKPTGWFVESVTAVAIACTPSDKPRDPDPNWKPTYCPECGGTNVLMLLSDPPQIECRDCKHTRHVNTYLRYKWLVRDYGARARPQHHEKLAEMAHDYRLTEEEAAREPGPEHNMHEYLAKFGGTVVFSEPTTIDKDTLIRKLSETTPIKRKQVNPYDVKHECSKCGDWMTFTGAIQDSIPPWYTFRCPSCNHYTSIFEAHL